MPRADGVLARQGVMTERTNSQRISRSAVVARSCADLGSQSREAGLRALFLRRSIANLYADFGAASSVIALLAAGALELIVLVREEDVEAGQRAVAAVDVTLELHLLSLW
jgi:hypothetical protein